MGARWAWVAICTNKHVYSNFSGGADACYECGALPEREIQCNHMWDNAPCDCKEAILLPPRDFVAEMEVAMQAEREAIAKAIPHDNCTVPDAPCFCGQVELRARIRSGHFAPGKKEE